MRQGPEEQRGGEAGEALARAADWHATLPPPVFASAPGAPASVRRYVGLDPDLDQPALYESVLCLHLGAPKQVRRRGGGRESLHEVVPGALSILPAGQAAQWSTCGPVDFVHLVLTPALLSRVALEEFDRDRVELAGAVGLRSPELEGLFRRLLPTVQARSGGRLYRDCLLVVLATGLIAEHSVRPVPAAPAPLKGGLAGWRLRRVLEYMAANLGRDVDLAELTALTGLSRAQFFRAFKQSTGSSPHRYLAALRLDRAKTLLETGDLPIEEVAAAVGLDGARFPAQFRARFAVAPSLLRLDIDSKN